MPRLPSWVGLSQKHQRLWVLSVLSVSLAFGVCAWFAHSQFEATIAKHQQTFGQLMTAVASQNRMSDEIAGLSAQKQLATVLLETSDDIAAVEFYDSDGTLMFETHRPLTAEQEKYLIDYAAPFEGVAGGAPGELHIKITGDSWRQLSSNVNNLILFVFTAAWLLAMTAIAVSAYLHSQQLKTLSRGVKRLSGGDFGAKIETGTLWGEIRTLAEGFNQMSAKLKTYTAQNQGQMALERHKLDAVLGSIVDGVVVCDSNGVIQMANDSAARLLEARTPDRLSGMSFREYTTTEGNRCFEPVLAAYFSTLQQPSSSSHPEYSQQLSFSGKTIKVSLSPLRDSATMTIVGFVMTLHDVTKEAEVDRLKTQFISNVSHELRTPVTTIKSYVDTVYHHGDDLDEQTRAEFLETIHVETDRLKKLVNDILDFSRLENGNIALEKSPQSIVPLINLTVQSVKMLAQQKSITLTTAIESNLPEVPMNSDSVERVLRNLLSNAIKYTPEGGRIKIRAEVVPVAKLGQCLELSVSDTGIGIPEEHIPLIFDRFYRVENQVHTVKGTGLGLHLVKMAIEEHHQGQVFVVSQPDQGSTFGFRLPLIPPLETPATPVARGSAANIASSA
ncbi:MAG: ATP-binding protein [Vampirovibrionales bacterium]|nr:ATP-binding protein [Vampirovibrionales bacterium]